LYFGSIWFVFFYIVKIQIWYENTRFASRYQKNKKCFVFMHTANTLTFFLRLLSKKQIFEVSKMCFRMDFLNTTKLFFLHFWILQHVCKTPKGIGQYSKKYKNLIFGEFIYYSPLMFG